MSETGSLLREDSSRIYSMTNRGRKVTGKVRGRGWRRVLCFPETTFVIAWNKGIPAPVGTGEDQPSQHLSGFVEAAGEALRCGGCGTHSSHCGRTTEMEKMWRTVLVSRSMSGAMSLCDLEGRGRL